MGFLKVGDVSQAGHRITRYQTQLSSNPALAQEDPVTGSGWLDPVAGLFQIAGVTFTPPSTQVAVNKMQFKREASPEVVRTKTIFVFLKNIRVLC